MPGIQFGVIPIAATIDTPETTIVGVVIKAQALAEWGKVERFYRVLHPGGWPWSGDLAQAIIRQSAQ
ncbi:MAG: hypothetical protein ACJAWC_003099 [Yoonia sp.]|jgi:hypothetical protein